MAGGIQDAADRERVKSLIVDVLYEDHGLWGSTVVAIVRGMMWALDGADPGCLEDVGAVLDSLGIPYAARGESVMVDPQWQRDHGLEPDMEEWAELTSEAEVTS